MGYPAKVQLIKRTKSEQWFVSFPAAVARAMEFVPSESVEWIIEDKSQLVLRRIQTPPSAVKKKLQSDSLSDSNPSGKKHGPPSLRKEPSGEANP